ncbi:MAG: septal ring lytic transglycosylase RlpA family protein [Nitrospira sp.]|nr:septal ring lytic transglycosylase RlpA family protein [Nitrospira sp.]
MSTEGGGSQYGHLLSVQSALILRFSRPYFCLSLGACSWVPKGDVQLDVGIKDRGVASWYGEQFHGRKAANGELFDMEALTAAHRTMPLGSIVRVINLNNGRHLHVRITDRGPYEKGRILDLSRRAALQLGMEHKGLAYVQVEIVGERRPDLAWLSEHSPGKWRRLLPMLNLCLTGLHPGWLLIFERCRATSGSHGEIVGLWRCSPPIIG